MLKYLLSFLLGSLTGLGSLCTIAAPVSPNIERRDMHPIAIDQENIELGLHVGMISIEDFSVETLMFFKAAYHITEDIFVEAGYGQASAGETSFESITNINLIANEDRDLSLLDLSVGWNLLPGESFIFDRFALTSSFYLISGVGQSEFSDNAEFMISLGAGYRLLLNDWLAIHLDARDYIYDSDILGTNKTTHNFAMTSGITVFF